MTTSAIDLDEIKARHAALSRTTKRRDTLEYVAGGLATGFLVVMSVATLFVARTTADWMMAAGFASLALGLATAGLYMFRYSTRIGADLAASGTDHLRRRLARERDLLRSAWLWYVGPMVPGFVLIYLGAWMADREHPAFALIAGGLTFAFLVLVVILNRRGARRIESEMRSLEE